MRVLDRHLYRLTAEDIMTNFDHSIEDGAEKLLMENKVYGFYPALDFHGAVWFEDGKFHCEVWHFGIHIDTVDADSLQGIMDTCSRQYGQG